MNNIALMEIESVAPVALGLLLLFGFMRLRLSRTSVRVYSNAEYATSMLVCRPIAAGAQRQAGTVRIRLANMDALAGLRAVSMYAGDIGSISYWGGCICFGQDFRSFIISDTIYDEFLVNGKLEATNDKKGIIANGAARLGILDVKDIGLGYRLLSPSLCQSRRLTIMFLGRDEIESEIGRYSKNSGLILMLLQNSNVVMRRVK